MEFFTEVGTKFNMFGKLHITISIVTVLLALCIFIFRDKLKTFKYKDKMRYVIAAILFLNMTVYYVTLAILDDYTLKTDLPLHFCFITGYLFMYILITNNRKLYKVVYFFTFIGPLPAMVWPDLPASYDRFIFYQFIISHHFMLLSSLYTLCVLEYKIERKDIIRAFLFGNVLANIMFVFNSIFQTNYFMMFVLPDIIYEIYPFTKSMPPIFWLELVAIFALLTAYIPVCILNKQDKKC